MSEKTFITTTLPYVNGNPHVGAMLEFLQADALKRYFLKIEHKTVFLNVGLDEHGLKVFTQAQKLNIDTQAYCNQKAAIWTDFCKQFKIGYDSFYRTTSYEHKKSVQKFWIECYERGNLYKKEYSGKYCVGCESFKTDADLINGKCPDHNVEPVFTSEENWFFKISKYKEQLLKWLDSSGSKFLTPNLKLNELRNVIEGSLDLSVSRNKESVSWGIPVPNDDTQVMYVWFEALCNYFFAANYNSYKYDNYWNGTTIQLCGPDNLRFQGHIFQTILESAGIKHTTKLLVHGTILDENGKKMSKSLNNVVDPMEQLDKFPLDAIRYYTLTGIHTCLNHGWSERELVDLYNTALADDYGNLLARTLHLIDTKNCTISDIYIDDKFKSEIESKLKIIREEWNKLNISKAIELTNGLLKFGNKYINNSKPWSGECLTCLNNLYFLLEKCTEYLEPVIPDSCAIVRECLKEKKKVIIFPKLTIKL